MESTLRLFLNSRLALGEDVTRELAGGNPPRWEAFNLALDSPEFNGLFTGRATKDLVEDIKISHPIDRRDQVSEYLGRFTGWQGSSVGNFVTALDLMERHELANKIRVAAGVAPLPPRMALAPIVKSAPATITWAQVASALSSQLPRQALIYLRDNYQPNSANDDDIFERNVKPTRDWRRPEACVELLQLLDGFRDGTLKQNPAVDLLRRFVTH